MNFDENYFGLFFFELILSSLKCTLSGHLLGSFDVLFQVKIKSQNKKKRKIMNLRVQEF